MKWVAAHSEKKENQKILNRTKEDTETNVKVR